MSPSPARATSTNDTSQQTVLNHRRTPMLHQRLAAYLIWAADFLSDPRRPHLLPFTLYRIRRERSRKVIGGALGAAKPTVLVTFDVERDSDQPPESTTSRTAADFLEAYLSTLGGRPYHSTFFVQGGMVRELAPLLLRAAAAHEVGLHGYNHELWGTRNWITRRIPPSAAVRSELLQRSLAAFRDAGLGLPVSFRAPNFTADRHTYRLLRSFGFNSDSSVPSQRGQFWTPQYDDLAVIPVSVAPTPTLYRNPTFKLPTALNFYQFNYANTVSAPMDTFRARVAEVFEAQRRQGRPLQLVMYAHNWEFFDLRNDPPTPNQGLRELIRRLDWLSDHHDAQFFTISEWTQVQRRQHQEDKGTQCVSAS